MPHVTLDDAKRLLTEAKGEAVEVRDSAGNVVGVMITQQRLDHLRAIFLDWADMVFPPEEMERVRNSNGPVRTMDEVLKHFGMAD